MKTPNGKLFVEQSIEIAAPASHVWKVLTNAELSEEWIKEWWPEVRLESEWKMDSLVFWKTDGGQIISQGKITFIDPERVLRYTFQVNPPNLNKKEEVTFVLNDKGGYTHFTISVGDFGDTSEHETYYPRAVDSWKRSLFKIKYLAENLSLYDGINDVN